MTARRPATAVGRQARRAAVLVGFLALAACAAPAAPTRWVKAGVGEAATARQLESCREQANAVLARQQGVNADITATLGGNWQRSNTLGIETQSLNNSAQGLAKRSLENCMLAKGFAKAS
jgi:hypothetical protein